MNVQKLKQIYMNAKHVAIQYALITYMIARDVMDSSAPTTNLEQNVRNVRRRFATAACLIKIITHVVYAISFHISFKKNQIGLYMLICV